MFGLLLTEDFLEVVEFFRDTAAALFLTKSAKTDKILLKNHHNSFNFSPFHYSTFGSIVVIIIEDSSSRRRSLFGLAVIFLVAAFSFHICRLFCTTRTGQHH